MASMGPNDIVMACRDCHMLKIADIAHKDKLMKCDICGKPMHEML